MSSAESSIPDRDDWGDISDNFDLRDAYDIFFGRSRRDAAALLSKNVLARAQDIRFMPKIPFSYYILGFCDLVLSGSYGDSHAWDVADSFISVLETRASENPEQLRSAFEHISKALDYILKNQNSLGLSVDIYGDLKVRSEFIESSVRNADI